VVDAVQLRCPLIATFMDRWRLETHTFHFSVGEMTLSLEDAAMLGGLPCAGQAMGPINIPATWHADVDGVFWYTKHVH
jgi:hypothetical protein